MTNSSWIWFLWVETIQINWLYSSLFYRLWRAKVWRCVTLFGFGKCRTIGCERSFRFEFKPIKFFEVCIEFKPNLIFGTWVNWKSRCGWVCEVRPTKTQMYLWCELNLEMGCVCVMAIRVVEFSNGGYKIRKVFA